MINRALHSALRAPAVSVVVPFFAKTTTRHVLAVMTIAVSSAVAWPSLSGFVRLGYTDDHYTHTLLIAPITLALIAFGQNLQGISGGRAASAKLLLLPAFFGMVAATQAWAPDGPYKLFVCILALILCWLLTVITCYGWRIFSSLQFPLMFLFLMVPLPNALINRVVHGLQVGSLYTASSLFTMAGIPFTAKGMVLVLPGLTIEVAEQCSGIRSSFALLVTTLVLGHLFLTSTTRKTLLFLCVIPLVFLKNGLRIFTLSILAAYVNPAVIHGPLHHFGGIVFFALSLGMVLTLLFSLARTQECKPRRVFRSDASESFSARIVAPPSRTFL